MQQELAKFVFLYCRECLVDDGQHLRLESVREQFGSVSGSYQVHNYVQNYGYVRNKEDRVPL